MTPRGKTDGGERGAAGGRLVGVVVGLVFVLVGTGALLVALREARATLAERRWPEAPATIVASSWDDAGGEEHPYRFLVRYRYEFGGRTYEGTVYRNRWGGDDDFEPVQRLLLRYPRGARVTCRVNPARPSEAVLEPRPPWLLLVLAFPLVFVATGAGVFAWSVRRPRREPLGARATVRRRGAGTVAAVLGAVLVLAGAGAGALMWPWLAGPIRAWGWAPVRATVVSSAVRRHESTDSEGRRTVTYKVDILYRYSWEGRTYLSNRYGFVGGTSSGYYGKRDTVRRFPPGTKVTAWVDPADPVEAVLVRGFTLAHLLCLIPLGLVAVGGALLARGLRLRAAPPTPAPGVPAPAAPAAPRTLEPGARRVATVGALLLFALLWNGIVAVFAWHVVQGFRHGRPDWLQAVFLVPFVLAGLLVVGLLLRAVLALANPRTTVTLLVPELRLGEPLRVAWRTAGRVGRLRRLELFLEGQEVASYRRGTTDHTETHTFRRLDVARLEAPSQMRFGEAEVTIPDDTMHTFRGQSNRIVWRLKVSGQIPQWPDVDDSWEVEILPMRPGEV